MNPQTYVYGNDGRTQEKKSPSRLTPILVVAAILIVWLAARRKDEIAENPLVDLLILTVGVAATIHVGHWISVKGNAPGLARFFTFGNSKGII